MTIQPDRPSASPDAPVSDDHVVPEQAEAQAGPPEPELLEPPEPPDTGDPALNDVVRRLAAAMNRPLEEQVARYDEVHRTLQDRLDDVEA